MSQVRAKFVVGEVTQMLNGGKIILLPVISGSSENERFFKMTPYGKIEIGTINPEVLKQFEPGKEFFIDFTAADK